MTAESIKPKPTKKRTKWDTQTIRKPRKGSKAEAILTLTTTTPATPPQIAEAVNTSRQMVHDVLKRYGITANTVESFRNHRADIIAAAQEKDIKVYLNLDDEERKKVIQKRGLVDFGILYDKERLERGQATTITDIRSLNLDATWSELMAYKERMSKQDQPQDVVVEAEEA